MFLTRLISRSKIRIMTTFGFSFFPLIWLLFFNTLANAKCPVPGGINRSKTDPDSIRAFLHDNKDKVSSIEDFVCCLPEEFRSNFVVAHSSIAGQSSHLRSPRVLMFNKIVQPNGELILNSLFTINGGDQKLNQSMSVEYMNNNRSTGEIEFFDIELKNDSFHFSSKNPESCMGCHGDMGKVPSAGPRPIFEPAGQWTSFIHGIASCTPSESTLSNVIQNELEKEWIKNPRFKCLNSKMETSEQIGEKGIFRSSIVNPLLSSLDQALEDLNSRRVAKTVLNSSDYGRFKFVILGSLICRGAGLFESRVNDFDKPENWIPSDALKTMIDESFLPKLFRGSERPYEVARKVIEDFKLKELDIHRNQRLTAKAILDGKTPHADFSKRATACYNPTKEEPFAPHKSIDFDVAHAQKSESGNAVFARYDAHTFSQSFRGQMGNSFFRFILEGRGIDTSNFGMEPTSGDYFRAHHSLSKYLIQREQSGPLYDMSGKILSFGSSTDLVKRSTCNELSKLSQKALSSYSEAKSVSPSTSVPKSSK
jgi:hypothetical protein